MKTIQVNSEGIKEIGWENQILQITFKHGGVYQYLEVPQDVFVKMKNASSVGHFFHSDIKDNYSSIKV